VSNLPHVSEQATLVTDADGAAWWEIRGRRLPVIAGGDDGDGGDGAKGGEPDADADKAGKPDPDDTDDDGAQGETEKERKLRAEAKALRTRAREAETERDRLKAATQTEAEKAIARAEAAEKRATEATERVRKVELRTAVTAEAAELGITDVKAAMRLMDTDAIAWDEDTDEPSRKSVSKALAAAVREFPSLRGKASVDAGERGGGNGTPASEMNDTLRRLTGRR